MSWGKGPPGLCSRVSVLKAQSGSDGCSGASRICVGLGCEALTFWRAMVIQPTVSAAAVPGTEGGRMPLGAGYGDVFRVRFGTFLPSECSPAGGVSLRTRGSSQNPGLVACWYCVALLTCLTVKLRKV
ncbi:unnamed protein product [Natator depressus]